MKEKVQIGHRKIQRIQKAHYVNLPKIWMDNSHAKKGDYVQVRLELDGSLNISVAPATACKHEADAASPTPQGEEPTCQDISSFLAKNPSIQEILQFVEHESQRIAAERKKPEE
jgi:hypothetical protein